VGDLTDLARQIATTTRVVSDARQAAPGKPVSVAVIPGFNSSVPTGFNFMGTSAVPLGPVSALAGKLTPLITKVEVTVEYTVNRDDGSSAAGQFTANPPLPVGGSHPLEVEFLFRPPISEDIRRAPASRFVIQVDITVELDGVRVSTKDGSPPPIRLPVATPALGIPAVLVLAQHSFGTGDYPGEVLCMVRSASPLRSLDKVVETLNNVAETIQTVQDLLGLAGVLNPLDGIDLILDAFQKAPIVFFAVGGAPDFNEFGGWDTLGFGGFDDEASSALLLGPTGTRARVWSSEDFSDSDWHEHSTFEVPDIGLANGLPAVGFGLYRSDHFGDWDTDAGDSMQDEIESARFL